VFRLCTVKPLVTNAGKLLKLSNDVLGSGATAAIMKVGEGRGEFSTGDDVPNPSLSTPQQTFFAQFVAGENAVDIKPVLSRLRSSGVGAILDYAAEADVNVATGMPAGLHAQPQGAAATGMTPEDAAREPELDANLTETLSGLATAAEGGGFAAVKVTALAHPELLQRVSCALEASRRIFRALVAASGAAPPSSSGARSALYTATVLSRQQFGTGMGALAQGVPLTPGQVDSLFALLDINCDGVIDFLDFTDGCEMASGLVGVGAAEDAAAAAGMPSAAALQAVLGLTAPAFRPERTVPSVSSAPPELSASELAQWAAVHRRGESLASAARALGVTVMVDAEQTYLQPAIEAVGTAMSRRFNRPEARGWTPPEAAHARRLAGGEGGTWPYNAPATAAPVNLRHGAARGAYPVVYNTYQAYLKAAGARMALGMARAEREQWLFGAKLVRGAYMAQERSRAVELGYKDPIHATISGTHAEYAAGVEAALARVVAQRRGELMVATHNEATVASVTASMSARGLNAGTCGVFFGQLLGMCDHVTLSLGRAGYAAFKYVPYGPVNEVMPYLIRRAQENSDLVSGGVAKELSMLGAELRRRLHSSASSSNDRSH
jgi:proline dehydrogenase